MIVKYPKAFSDEIEPFPWLLGSKLRIAAVKSPSVVGFLNCWQGGVYKLHRKLELALPA